MESARSERMLLDVTSSWTGQVDEAQVATTNHCLGMRLSLCLRRDNRV